MSSPPRLLTSWGILRLVVLALLVATGGCSQRTTRLDRVKASGMLRVATDPSFPPFEYVDGDGNIVGFDADLARAVASRLGAEAHLINTGYDALYDALTVDQADIIISALYPDPTRGGGFAFSKPYFNAGQVLVTLDGAGITAVADLPGRPVGCMFGTTGHMEALQWQETLDPAPLLTTFEDPSAMASLLHEGTVSAVIVDHVSALLTLSQDASLEIVLPPVTDEPYVIATRLDDDQLLKAIEEILQDLEDEGAIEALIAAWMHP